MKKLSTHTFRHLFHPQTSNNHRARLLHPEWSLTFAILAVVAVAVISSMSMISVSRGGFILGYATNITVDEVVARTNVERQTVGVGQLTLSAALSRAAQAKANDMFANQYWAHVSPAGKQPWDFIHESGYSYSAAGENLARDFYQTDPMISAWMASPTHRANIVNGKYTQIGIAVVNGTLNGTETTLVVQMFGLPLESATEEISPVGVQQQETTQLQVSDSNEPRPTPQTLQRVTAEAKPAPADRQPQGIQDQPQVLAAFSFLTGAIRPWPSISPLQFVKALALVLTTVVISVILFDWTLMWVSPRSRLVGHNLAHFLFLITVIVLVFTFQAGLIR